MQNKNDCLFPSLLSCIKFSSHGEIALHQLLAVISSNKMIKELLPKASPKEISCASTGKTRKFFLRGNSNPISFNNVSVHDKIHAYKAGESLPMLDPTGKKFPIAYSLKKRELF